MSDRQAQQDARDAEFGETPFGATSICPLYLECAIFPVRYAIDETSSEREEPQGPHPLAEAWQRHGYPDLQTRSYCLRQLRDGWLYVWDEIDRTFHEYRIVGHQFTRIPWPEDVNETRPDERKGDGESKPYLLYPCRSRIWLAYSPAQWTWRICEHMRSNVDARRRFMRPLNIRSAIVDPEHTAHVGPLNELGQHLADITPQGAASDFDSTTVMTRALTQEEQKKEDETEYVALAHKPEIDQNAVLAQVPDKDQALFVALDDQLGIVNDLTMNLLGREMELEHFTDQHGHQLQTARVVQELCLVDIDELVDAEARDDPERYRESIIKTGELMDVLASMERGSDHTLVAKEMQARRLREELRELGMSNPPGRNSPQYHAWHAKERPRLDVRLDEVIECLAEHGPQLERQKAECQHCCDDLIAWLDRLPTSAQALCFDGCNALQTQALLEFTRMVSEALGASEEGRQWLTERVRRRDNLIGLALFNFSPSLAEALDAIAREWLEETPGSDAESAITASDVAGVANNLKSVLDLEHVQQSALFQALAQPVQDTFATLQKVVAGAGRQAWEALAYLTLPAAGAGAQVGTQQIAKGVSIAMLAAFVHPDNQGAFLQRNDGTEAQQRRWRAGMLRLSMEIKAQQLLLYTPMSPSRRAELFRTIGSLENDYQALALHEPKRFTAGPAQGATASLATLGFDELREQHRLRIERGAGSAAAARRRMAQWVESRGIGGLPLLVATLNLANVADSIRNAQRDGMSQADLEKIASQASYASAAVMALWVMPYWQRHANGTALLRGNITKIAGAGISRWEAAGQANTARIAARLSSRVAGMAAFAAIGAGVEAWQIWQQLRTSNSHAERLALTAKLTTTVGMAAIGSFQLGGALAGRWFAFGWILAPWASWALLILSAGYLLASMFSERYRREGVRLWLYRSTWGKATQWSDSDADRVAELRDLNEALFAPALKLTPVVRTEFDVSRTPSQYSPGRRVETLQGYWIQLALPAAMGGEKVTITQDASGGFWAPSASFKERPATRRDMELPGASSYSEEEPLRVWQAWLPAERLPDGQPFLLNVTYDEAIYGDAHGGLSFTFYKAEPRQGKYEVEVNDRYRGLCSSATIELTVPTP